MNPGTLADVAQLLRKAGYEVHSQAGFLYFVDPTCIWPPLLEFINTAWIVLTVITAFLLLGWGITMVRGAAYSMTDIAKNLRALLLIFGTLSVAIPAVNVLGAGKYVVSQCNVIKISRAQVKALMDLPEQPIYQATVSQDSYNDNTGNNIDNEFNF